MGVFSNALERAERQHAADHARVESIRSDIQAREAAPRDGVSFEALVAADDEVVALRRKLAIAEGVASDSAGKLERALADVRDDEAKRRHGEMERKAVAAAKRVKRIAELSAELRDEIATHNDHVAEFEKYNREERGKLPFIPDAERSLREIPARTIPATYRDEVVWEDKAGYRPKTYRHNRDGELEPIEAGFTRKVVKVYQQQERLEPAKMPTRLADAIKLVDLQGKALWPR